MKSVEFIKQICRERNIPISRLEHDLGFSNGYIRNMTNRTLSADRAAKIAEYLNVPVEQIIRPNVTPPEAPVSRQAATMAPIMLELIQNASEANIEDIAMASDMLKRLNAYRKAIMERIGGES